MAIKEQYEAMWREQNQTKTMANPGMSVKPATSPELSSPIIPMTPQISVVTNPYPLIANVAKQGVLPTIYPVTSPPLVKPPDPPYSDQSKLISGIKEAPEVTKVRRVKKKRVIPLKYSCEEIYERMENGLCIFCEEQDSPDHQLKHKRFQFFIKECDAQPFDEEVLVEPAIEADSLIHVEPLESDSVLQMIDALETNSSIDAKEWIETCSSVLEIQSSGAKEMIATRTVHDKAPRPEKYSRPNQESYQAETFLYPLIQAVNLDPKEFKTFYRNRSIIKTFYLEDSQEDAHEQKEVMTLISSWIKRVWEPGGVLNKHDKWKGLENRYNLSSLMRLMQRMCSIWWQGIQSRELHRIAACSLVGVKMWLDICSYEYKIHMLLLRYHGLEVKMLSCLQELGIRSKTDNVLKFLVGMAVLFICEVAETFEKLAKTWRFKFKASSKKRGLMEDKFSSVEESSGEVVVHMKAHLILSLKGPSHCFICYKMLRGSCVTQKQIIAEGLISLKGSQVYRFLLMCLHGYALQILSSSIDVLLRYKAVFQQSGKDITLLFVYHDSTVHYISSSNAIFQVTKKEAEFVVFDISGEPGPPLLKGFNVLVCVAFDIYGRLKPEMPLDPLTKNISWKEKHLDMGNAKEPALIFDMKMSKRHHKAVTKVLTLWKVHPPDQTTWRLYQNSVNKYPLLAAPYYLFKSDPHILIAETNMTEISISFCNESQCSLNYTVGVTADTLMDMLNSICMLLLGSSAQKLVTEHKFLQVHVHYSRTITYGHALGESHELLLKQSLPQVSTHKQNRDCGFLGYLHQMTWCSLLNTEMFLSPRLSHDKRKSDFAGLNDVQTTRLSNSDPHSRLNLYGDLFIESTTELYSGHILRYMKLSLRWKIFLRLFHSLRINEWRRNATPCSPHILVCEKSGTWISISGCYGSYSGLDSSCVISAATSLDEFSLVCRFLLDAFILNLLAKQSRECGFFGPLAQWKWHPP